MVFCTFPPINVLAEDSEVNGEEFDTLNVATSGITAASGVATRNFICLAGRTYKVEIPGITNLDFSSASTGMSFNTTNTVTYEVIRINSSGSFHDDFIDSSPQWTWFTSADLNRVHYYTFLDNDARLSVIGGADIIVEEVNRDTIASSFDCILDWSVLTTNPTLLSLEVGSGYTNRFILKFDKRLRKSDCIFDSIMIKNINTNETFKVAADMLNISDTINLNLQHFVIGADYIVVTINKKVKRHKTY